MCDFWTMSAMRDMNVYMLCVIGAHNVCDYEARRLSRDAHVSRGLVLRWI